MNDIDVLLSIHAFHADALHRELPEMSPELLAWQTDDEANCIGVTVWHFSRQFDFLKTRVFADNPQDEELWFSAGWADKTGYDPRGKGMSGLGTLIGYSQAEVAEVPLLSIEELLAYFDACDEALRGHLQSLPPNSLEQNAPGLGGERTRLYWWNLIVLDATRHMGEILALKAMWERRNQD